MNLSLQQMVEYKLIDRFMRDRNGSQYLQHMLRISEHECDREGVSMLINHFGQNILMLRH